MKNPEKVQLQVTERSEEFKEFEEFKDRKQEPRARSQEGAESGGRGVRNTVRQKSALFRVASWSLQIAPRVTDY